MSSGNTAVVIEARRIVPFQSEWCEYSTQREIARRVVDGIIGTVSEAEQAFEES